MIIYLSRTLCHICMHVCKGCVRARASDTCQHFVKFLVCCQLSLSLSFSHATPCCLGHLSNTLHDVICQGMAKLAVYKRFDSPAPFPLLLRKYLVCCAKFTYRLAEGLHNEGHSMLLHCTHSSKWLTVIRLPMGMENH